MDIVVLAGGLSVERDVSIITGKMVTAALKKNGHNVILLDVYTGYNGSSLEGVFESGYDFSKEISSVAETVPDLEKIKNAREGDPSCFLGNNVASICKRADIVFMALHGDNGENGKLQATFDILGIKYTGTGSLGSALALNKGLSKRLFITDDIPTPKSKLFIKAQSIEENKWGLFPCVVKPCSGGSSVGVAIANNLEEFKKALKESFRFEEEVLVEQYIKGREFSVGVLAGEALPIIEICPKAGFYDYKNKYQAGLTEEICPALLSEEVTEEMQRQALRVFDTLMLETYARIDFLMDEQNNMYCLEANTLPGMTPTSLLPQEAQQAGLSYEELCEEIILHSLKKYK